MTYRFEDAASLSLAGFEVYAYGLALMLGCWAGLGLLYVLARKDSRTLKAAALTGLLVLPLGLILSRLLYCLGDPGFAPLMSLKNALDLTTGGFAMYGALAGAVLAAIPGARLAGIKPKRMLDLTAPALAAFLIPARLGEGFTALGISRPLTTQWLADSFLAFRDEYDAYLRTYLLEAASAALLLIFLLRHLKKNGREGSTFMLGCLLYGVTQTLMESLRFDGHLRYSFIGIQQVLSALLFSCALIALAVRLLKESRNGRWLPIISLALLPFVLGALIGVEFLVDRSGLGKLFSYAFYLPVLAVPAVFGILMLRRRDYIGQGTD
jgi:prolipoprotein diacylglyceryltransferase